MAKCKNCMNFKLVDEKKTKYRFCPCTMDSKDPDEERECAFYKHMTNGDRIRNMTDEELAELVSSGEWACICPMCEFYGTTDCAFDEDYGTEDKKICAKGVMKWLQSQAEE